jgi:hypothetical protein
LVVETSLATLALLAFAVSMNWFLRPDLKAQALRRMGDPVRICSKVSCCSGIFVSLLSSGEPVH